MFLVTKKYTMDAYWEEVANARRRAPFNPQLPSPMSQQHYQGMVQQGLNPSEYYNPNSAVFAGSESAHANPNENVFNRIHLPATLVQVDDGSMAASASASNSLNFAARRSSGRFPDRNIFSADARTMQRDMVSLVAGWLAENGYLSTALTLADEAGAAMTNDYHHRKMLRTVAKHVEEGAWEAAHQAIARCRAQNSSSRAEITEAKSDTEGSKAPKKVHHISCVERGIDFLMLRQQYLELIEASGAQQTTGHFKRLSKFEGYIGEEHYQTLASLLACRSISGDGARMYPALFKDWSVAKGRQQIVAELMRQADESLNPCAYVTSLNPRPESGELSTMVSEALSYRLLRNNPALATRVINGEPLLPEGAQPFQIPSLLKVASLSGEVSLQLPPQRLLSCFDFNSKRPPTNTPLHSYYRSLPYTTYFKVQCREGDHSFHSFVHINSPTIEENADLPITRITSCAPLLSRSTIILGTRTGELIGMKVPTRTVGLDLEAESGGCETIAQLSDRVWAIDTAVVGPTQSGDFCRRDLMDLLEVDRMRPANGGSAEVFVGAVSGNTVTVLSLTTRRIVRVLHNDGSDPRGTTLLMSHQHKQLQSPTGVANAPATRSEHDAQRDLMSITLFSPNNPAACHFTIGSAPHTNAERASETQRKKNESTEGPSTQPEPSNLVVDHCSGQQLLGAVGSEGGDLIVFDVFNSSLYYKVRSARSCIVSIEFSTTGNSLYVGYKDGYVRVVDTSCGVIVRHFEPSLSLGSASPIVSPLSTAVSALTMSSNGTLLAVSYSSSTIHLIDLPSGQPLPIYLVGHNTNPKQQSRLCFGATSRIVVSASDDGFLCVWDLSDVLSDLNVSGAREGMTALMPTRRIPLRMGSALAAPRYLVGDGGASALGARDHNRLVDSTSDVKYDRAHDLFVVTTEDGKVFLVGL